MFPVPDVLDTPDITIDDLVPPAKEEFEESLPPEDDIDKRAFPFKTSFIHYIIAFDRSEDATNTDFVDFYKVIELDADQTVVLEYKLGAIETTIGNLILGSIE